MRHHLTILALSSTLIACALVLTGCCGGGGGGSSSGGDIFNVDTADLDDALRPPPGTEVRVTRGAKSCKFGELRIYFEKRDGTSVHECVTGKQQRQICALAERCTRVNARKERRKKYNRRGKKRRRR